mgnify:FL=1
MSLRFEENIRLPSHQGRPMAVRANDKEYTVTFGYDPRCPATTICTIKGDSLLSRQIAAVSPHDTFNRAIGRKVSLAHAIQQAFPRGEQRKAFWTAYWLEREKRTGKKWAA